MVLTEENFKEIILSYTLNDWKPILNLIDEIENTKKFYEVGGGGELEDGTVEFPYHDYYPIIHKFLKVVYQIPIIVDFSWMSWEEGAKMLKDESFDFDTIDIPTKCLLITTIVRSEKYCEGTLGAAFQNGTIPKILKSIQKELNSKNPA